MQKNQLRHAVDEKPSGLVSLALAFTHVLLIFDAVIFIPNVLCKTVSMPQDSLQFMTFGSIIVAALFTFLQSKHKFGIGAGFILFTGSYSAFLVCSIDAMNMGGLKLLATMSLITVPIIFLYTFFIRFFRHIITPAVGGVVILLIAVSMVPIGLDLWAGAESMTSGQTLSRLMIGGVTIAALTLLMLFGARFLKLWSPLIAMALGYATSFFTGQLSFDNTANAAWIGLPPMAWPGLEMNISALHVPLMMAFSMAMVASMIESTGDIMLVQQISKRNFRRVDYGKLQGGLYCDGLSKITAGLLGTAVPSIYCDNLPLIEMTGVASRRIGQWGAAILLALAFMPKISGIILDMPGPVIGGFLIVIAALLFHAGIGLVTMTKLGNQHGIIIGLSLTVGLVAESGSFFPKVVPESLSPLLQNSVAMGGFTAFLLSTIAHLMPKKTIQGTFSAVVGDLPKIQEMLKAGRAKLDLSHEDFDRLSLCCEEVFCHMAESGTPDEERKVTIRTSLTEEGCFTEMVSGHKMDDINNFATPDSLFHAKPEDLKQLGLVLFSLYARDPKHIEISGYSYISFLI